MVYDNYVSTNIKWLSKIPSHWFMIKSKRIFCEISIKDYPNEKLLASTQKQGVIPKELYENTTVMPRKNLENFKLVNIGNFVISLRSFEGGIEYSDYKGIISPAYTILKSIMPIEDGYFKYLFKSHIFIKILASLTSSVREGKNIDTVDFFDLYLPYPTINEQKNIYLFLDKKSIQIEDFIAKKLRFIALLKELKEAVINEAVTKGIDKTAPLKSSGIEFLGCIPVHWETRKLKFVTENKADKKSP